MPAGEFSEVTDGMVHVRLAGGETCSRLDVECILDITGDGEVIGIEVLDFQAQAHSPDVTLALSKSGNHLAYDEEIDALYVRLGLGSAPRQQKVTGSVLMDAAGRLIGLQVPYVQT